MHAFHAVAQQGDHSRIGVEQVQELHGFHGMSGVGGNSHHRALHGGVVDVGSVIVHQVGHLHAAGLGSGHFVAVEGNLGGDQVIRGVLRIAPGVGCGFADGDGGIDVTGLEVFAHLLGELLKLGGGELADQLGAVSAGGGHVFLVVVVAQQQVGVAGNDAHAVHDALRHSAFKDEGIEGLAFGFFPGLDRGEDVAPAVETSVLHIVQRVAVLLQQGHVHVPAVHGSEILEARDGVDALFAVFALGLGAFQQQGGQSGFHVLAVLVQQVVFRVVQTDERALLGVGSIFVAGPGAGEHHVVLVAAGVDGIAGQIVEIGPGAPNGLHGHADLLGQIGVQLFQHSRIVGHVAAFKQNGDFHGGFCQSGGQGRHDQQRRQYQREQLFHGFSSLKCWFDYL